MNLQQLKEIINEYKNEISKFINYKQPAKNKNCEKLLNKINKNNNYYFCRFTEIIYLINNYDNLENLHIFCECGNKNTFKGLKQGYTQYCSNICKNHSIKYINKCKQTKLNNIDENGLNSYQRAILKEKQTKLNKIDKNGLNSYERQSIKRINTMLNDIDENGLNSLQRSAIKIKQTKLNNIDKNGLNSYQRSVIKSIQTAKNNIDKNGLNSYQRAKIKQYQTKKKNHTFNTSKDEEQIYNYLLKKFNKDDVIRQYRSKLYPFACDFYIKSLDLYIEYHGTWTHGKKPFKNSIEDLQKLEELKKKNSKYYNNMIYTWTNLDIRKLQTFKKNKLNYKIFYRIKHFLNWYNKIY